MVKFINKYSRGEMWVAEDRVDEYIKAGHTPADSIPTEPKETVKETVKKVVKKATKKV